MGTARARRNCAIVRLTIRIIGKNGYNNESNNVRYCRHFTKMFIYYSSEVVYLLDLIIRITLTSFYIYHYVVNDSSPSVIRTMLSLDKILRKTYA